jgi:hypothetical protein
LTKDESEAAETWLSYVETEPGYLDLIGIAELHIGSGEPESALRLLRSAEEFNCGERDYLYLLIAEAAYDANSLDVSREYLSRAESENASSYPNQASQVVDIVKLGVEELKLKLGRAN